MVDVTGIILEHILSETVNKAFAEFLATERLRIKHIIFAGKASLPRFLTTKARGFLRGD